MIWYGLYSMCTACFLCNWLAGLLHFEHPKGPEEQFLLFGEIFPDTFRVSLCQDEEMAVRRVARKSRESPVPMEMDPLFDMDVLMSEFSDTLFSTLASHQPMAWPNPREIGEGPPPTSHSIHQACFYLLRSTQAFLQPDLLEKSICFSTTFFSHPIRVHLFPIAHAGNADMIQPGLIPLQPNLDFMDSFEPLQGNDNALYHSDKLQNNVTCTVHKL